MWVVDCYSIPMGYKGVETNLPPPSKPSRGGEKGFSEIHSLIYQRMMEYMWARRFGGKLSVC